MANTKYSSVPTTDKLTWHDYLESGDWTTYLAYKLKKDSSNDIDTLLKYEALLTQCSYLSRMAYCPADIFCRMTQHLDVTPNAFNNYIRAIEKIYENLFNYKCSYDSKYIQDNPKFQKYFTPIKTNPIPATAAQSLQSSSSAEFNTNGIKNTPPIGFFIRNNKDLNVYLYVHDNPDSGFNKEKTLFITFKGSSNINDFIHDLKSAAQSDRFLRELNMKSTAQNSSSTAPQSSNVQNTISQGKAGYRFIDILKESIPVLCAKIEELKKSQGSERFKKVIITGHSLGGALASLFGYYLKKYNSELIDIDIPIHIITFGACCLFDAPGRNQFNYFLNISSDKPGIFTLDRVTVNADPIIILPPDLDHPGYTLLKTEIKAYTKTGRTNEIGKIREMLGLTSGYDGNDLLLSENFVNLFINSQDFKGTGRYDTDLYRSKFRIIFGSNAKEQQLILKKAMPDANEEDLRELFKKIESETGNKRYDAPQKGGFDNPLSKNKRQQQNNGTKIYKEKTKTMMPNQINYNCYKTMTMGFCHASYMGVSYIMVLRLPNIKGGFKLKKKPMQDYTLYQKDGRIFSLSNNGEYTSNADCKQPAANSINGSNLTNANANPANASNQNANILNRKNKPKRSFMNSIAGIFKKPKNNIKNKNSSIETTHQLLNQNQNQNQTSQNSSSGKGESWIQKKCSIL
jgi:hypothetical protein